MAGYDFNVQPAQIESPLGAYGKVMQIRNAQQESQARALEVQQRQIQLDEMKRQQKLEANQRAAAGSAYQPQSYTPQANSINVGGANLGYQPATVQGPPQVNRGLYLDALRQTDPMGAMQAQQQFESQDIEHATKMAALNEGLAKASKEQIAAAVAANGALGQYFQAVDSAPDELKPSIYQQVRQHAIDSKIPGVENTPAQYDPGSFGVMKSQWLTVQQTLEKAQKDREFAEQQAKDAETARHNKADESNTRRGQDLTAGRENSQVMQVPQPDGTVKLVRVKVGDSVPVGAKTTAAAQKDAEDATVDEKKKADLVTNARENLAALRDIITRRPELFGPLAGRLTSLRAAAGTDDEDISKLAGIKDRFGMVNQGLHSMRSASHVAEAGDAVLNKMRNSPEATLAAIDEAEKSLDTFQLPVSQQRGNLTGKSGGGSEIHYKIVNGKLVKQ